MRRFPFKSVVVAICWFFAGAATAIAFSFFSQDGEANSVTADEDSRNSRLDQCSGNLEGVCRGLHVEAESLSIARFDERADALRRYYDGDAYAQAMLALAESQVQRHLRESRSDEATLLARAEQQIQLAKQKLLAVEMEVYIRRGGAEGALGNRDQEILFLKRGITKFEDAVPPLYADIVKDAPWIKQVRDLYYEGARNLVHVASIDELSPTYLTPGLYFELSSKFPDKIEGVVRLSPASGRRHRIAVNRLNVLLQDGEFLGDDQQQIKRTIELLENWVLNR